MALGKLGILELSLLGELVRGSTGNAVLHLVCLGASSGLSPSALFMVC